MSKWNDRQTLLGKNALDIELIDIFEEKVWISCRSGGVLADVHIADGGTALQIAPFTVVPQFHAVLAGRKSIRLAISFRFTNQKPIWPSATSQISSHMNNRECVIDISRLTPIGVRQTTARTGQDKCPRSGIHFGANPPATRQGIAPRISSDHIVHYQYREEKNGQDSHKKSLLLLVCCHGGLLVCCHGGLLVCCHGGCRSIESSRKDITCRCSEALPISTSCQPKALQAAWASSQLFCPLAKRTEKQRKTA